MSDWRESQAQILSAFSEVGQVKIAATVGLSEPTISGLKSPQGRAKLSVVELMARLIDVLDLKLVAKSASVLRPGERAVPAKKLAALQELAGETLQRDAVESQFGSLG